MELVLQGKKVVIRDKVTLEEGYELFGQVMDSSFRDAKTQVPLLTALIESWEFPGDPKDPKVYEKLDLFREFVPLVNAVNAYINQMMTPAESKNSRSKSSN